MIVFLVFVYLFLVWGGRKGDGIHSTQMNFLLLQQT